MGFLTSRLKRAVSLVSWTSSSVGVCWKMSNRAYHHTIRRKRKTHKLMCYWRLSQKHSSHASLGHAILQQKLLRGPWFGAPKACVPACLLLQRSASFSNRHRYDMLHYDIAKTSEVQCTGMLAKSYRNGVSHSAGRFTRDILLLFSFAQ